SGSDLNQQPQPAAVERVRPDPSPIPRHWPTGWPDRYHRLPAAAAAKYHAEIPGLRSAFHGDFMSVGEFFQWQWRGYRAAHQNEVNLVLHIVAVPIFMSATLLAGYALVRLSWLALLAATFCFLISLIMQGRGHKLEVTQPEPFKGVFDFILRLFA